MDYQIAELKEKTVVGLTARTRNADEDMPRIIGELWQEFLGGGVYESIPNKKNDKSIGLYSDYESDVNGAYDVTVCCEVDKVENLTDSMQVKTISAGKYARFIIYGHVQKAVSQFWTKLWQIPLDRKYSCDFEEYQGGSDMQNCEIHIYIALGRV